MARKRARRRYSPALDVAAEGFYRGHPTVCIVVPECRDDPDYFDDWRYVDTLTPSPGNAMFPGPERPCVRCKVLPDFGGPDPCLGMLPNVQAACCGHGVEQGYVFFDDGRILRGLDAHHYFATHGCAWSKIFG